MGEEGGGFYTAMATLEQGRTPTAAIQVGIARAALDTARKFTKGRRQFGQPIASFQTIQQKIADMAESLHGQALFGRGSDEDNIRGDADPRSPWMYEGISGGALFQECKDIFYRRGDSRDAASDHCQKGVRNVSRHKGSKRGN